MIKTAQHLSIILLIGVMLALVGYGSKVSTAAKYQATQEATQEAGQATSQALNLPATRPVVRANLNGDFVDGTPGSYCWPSSGTSPQCDFVEEIQPDNPISVSEGIDLKFEIDPASPAPQEFRATLTDDKEANGNPIRVDLAESGGAYTVKGLSSGNHHVLVETFYPGESAESQFFVSYGFLLQVGATAVAMATEASPAATSVVTAAVEVSTAEPTVVEATESAQPTEASTSSVEATPELTQPTVEPPTVAPPTVVPPTAELVTAEAVTAASATAEPSTPELPTIAPPTVMPPTLEPSPPPLPTLVPTPIVLPPTVISPSPVPTVVAAAPTSASVAPALIVVVAGRNYDPVAVNACVLGSDGSQTCITRPFNAASERIFSAPGDTAQIAFQGPRPTSINVNVLSADAVTVINKQTITPDNLSLYALPANVGNYVLAVDIVWPAGKATYYYRLTVNG